MNLQTYSISEFSSIQCIDIKTLSWRNKKFICSSLTLLSAWFRILFTQYKAFEASISYLTLVLLWRSLMTSSMDIYILKIPKLRNLSMWNCFHLDNRPIYEIGHNKLLPSFEIFGLILECVRCTFYILLKFLQKICNQSIVIKIKKWDCLYECRLLLPCASVYFVKMILVYGKHTFISI